VPAAGPELIVIAAVAGFTHRKTLNPKRAKLVIKPFLPLDMSDILLIDDRCYPLHIAEIVGPLSRTPGRGNNL
jgi:hypothetical protein